MTPNPTVTFGQRLHQLRTDRHMAQSTLADRAWTFTYVIRRYEAGEQFPQRHTMARLAKVLGVTYYELLDGVTLPGDESR